MVAKEGLQSLAILFTLNTRLISAVQGATARSVALYESLCIAFSFGSTNSLYQSYPRIWSCDSTMLAQKGLQRPCGNFDRQGCRAGKWHRGCLIVQARERSGPSGIHIEGNSPTSPKGWEIMRQKLTDAGVKILSPQEAIFARDKGTVIVDVRPEGDYDEGHVPGAANVPFYQPITGWSPFKVARRVGYAMFGVLKGTEVNPDFAAGVRELVSNPEKGVILYCSQGGVLECNENYKRGWQTRSLVAAYDLLQEGLINVSIMKGGYTEWANSGRDIEIMELVEEEGETAETAEQAETAKVQRN